MGLGDRIRQLAHALGVDPRTGTPPTVDADANRNPPAPVRPPSAPVPSKGRQAKQVRDPLLEDLAKASVPTDLAQLVLEHRDWLDHCLPDHKGYLGWGEHQEAEQKIADDLRSAADEQLRAAATLSVARLHNAGDSPFYSLAATAHQKLSRRKMSWTPAQVGWLLRSATGFPAVAGHQAATLTTQLAPLGVGAAERLDTDGQAALAEDLTALREAMETSTKAGAKMAARVSALLSSPDPSTPPSLPPEVLPEDDRYGHLARAALEGHNQQLVVTTLTHLGAYSGTVSAATMWRRKTAALIAAHPNAPAVAADLLRALLTHRDYTRDVVYGRHTFHEPVFVDQATGQLLRAAVWMVALAPDVPDRLALLGDTAVHCGTGFGGSGSQSRLSGAATSAVAALAELAQAGSAPEQVVAQLARISAKVVNKPIRKAVDGALDRAAAAAGLTAGQLLEQAVPDFGLSSDGTAEVAVGDHHALLALESGRAGAKLAIRWRTPTGRLVAGVPAKVKADRPGELAELRTRAKEAKTAISVQRSRVEELLATGRTWAAGNWQARYVSHPVVGLTARSLLWQTRAGTAEEGLSGQELWVSGLPEREGERWLLRNHDGSAVEVGEAAEVRLWHPLQQRLAEVQAWRAHLADRSFRQPFKQAFREIYLLTPAEVETGTYSNRFAGHILRYPQAGALIRNRGWNGSHLGYWDGGESGQATKEFDGGWRVSFYYELVENDDDGYEQVSLCSTDQVRFEQHDGNRVGGGWNARPLTEVPDLMLSEAMRDVDLFVGVTSVAADPEWADRGADRFQEYWQRESFGNLGESAQMRKEALARLLPRTKLAGRVQLDDRFLVVSGQLRDYKIHLGSGNILMSPADTYLCIVPARNTKTSEKLYLPFEEDGGQLAVILSKAFLLADDTAITDTSITRQLRLGL